MPVSYTHLAAQLKADEEMLAQIRRDVIEILMPRVIASIHHEKVLALFNDCLLYTSITNYETVAIQIQASRR